MEFSRQEHWRGLPTPSPGVLPNPGIKPGYPALQADSLLSEPSGKTTSTIFQLKKKRIGDLVYNSSYSESVQVCFRVKLEEAVSGTICVASINPRVSPPNFFFMIVTVAAENRA